MTIQSNKRIVKAQLNRTTYMKKIKQFILNLVRTDLVPVQYDTELTKTYSDYRRGQR